MTTTDYPDLTAAAAASADELLPQARDDMAGPLASSRLHPLDAAPDTFGTEPTDFSAFLAASVPTALPLPSPARSPRSERPLHELGIVDLLAAYADGRTRPTQVLAALRTRWTDPEIVGGSILAIVESVDEAARESDRRWREGSARPLEGIYVGVKDIVDVAGAAVTAGSLTTGDRVAAKDATVVARLRAAGAIPSLITATTEFACGAPHNARYGAVTNPWDRSRWTGGSSTGSAGALAAGLVPMAIGTDTGGSIRVPSAFCNLTGIKPTYGLVPRTGVSSLSWSLDHVGPMARCAADLAAILRVIAGPDGVDSAAAIDDHASTFFERPIRPDSSGSVTPLRGLRIGVPTAWFTEFCDAEVLRAWRTAVDDLCRLGAQPVTVDIPDVGLLHDEFGLLLTSELASNQEGAAAVFDRFDIGTQVRISRGRVPTAVDYLRALRRRPHALRTTLDAFDRAGVDVLVTPGPGGTAPRLDDLTLEVDDARHPMQPLVGRNTGIFDHLGLPALMAPAGFSGGLPLGVQLVGRPWSDATIVNIAQHLQNLTEHHEQRAHG
ncbi:amidase [Gordonia sp. CPCC 206044]|uniref:amidase n=1 Tax=Gordonia sp. CPCC 206044 TaxID=3140793 RepID=UPI003AF3ED2A